MAEFIASVSEPLKKIYADYDEFILPAIKFLTALAVLFILKSYIGFDSSVSRPVFLLVMSLVCAFLPAGAITVAAAAFTVLNMLKGSLSMTLVMCVFCMIVMVICFGLRPGRTVVIALMPVFMILKVPYMIPLSLAMTAGVSGVVPMTAGTVSWYIIRYYHDHHEDLSLVKDPMLIVKEFVSIVNSILDDRSLIVLCLVFILGLITGFLIAKTEFDHCRTAAIIASSIIMFLAEIAGDLYFEIRPDYLTMTLGMLISLILILILDMFVFNVDYKGKQKLSFEDDEYVYYVKALPKVKSRKNNET